MRGEVIMTSISGQRKAVIDIGTNSIILCIAENSNTPDGYSVIHDEIRVTRLGEGLDVKKGLGELPSVRSIDAIQHFVAKAHEFNVNEIRAVGTAALRKAENAGDFCTRVKDICGIDVDIISGELEAQLSHSAASVFAYGQDCILFDIGGGSAEFVYSKNNEIIYRLSLNFGVLNIHEKYFLNELTENDSISKAYFEAVNNLHKGGLKIPEADFTLIGIGGTITTMASVKLKLSEFLPDKVNGTILSISDIESQIYQYQNLSLKERARVPGLCADRADIILAGACIVKAVMDFFNTTNVTVSTNGLRHTLLAGMFK
jgi:exopolyphosphatase/guanosine-5'-triphosphate,3'-diphosphate pyrophosphatase